MNLKKDSMVILNKKEVQKNKYIEIENIDKITSNRTDGLIFPLDLWISEKQKLIKIDNKVGIKISSSQTITDIIEYLSLISVVQFNFTTFKDGRPFTLARKLREIYQYKGEIRASGHILPDQYIFLLRCGFNSVEIEESKVNIWRSIFDSDEGLYYQ